MSLQTENFKAIADAIREKKGTSDPIKATDFASEVLSIETGIFPSGELEITESGKYDVTNYASANVNIASSGEDMLQARVDLGNSCEKLFYGYPYSTMIDISRLKTGNATRMISMFESCQATSLDLSHLDTSNIKESYGIFKGCNALTSVNLNNWNTGKMINFGSLFYQCSKLKNLDLSHFNTSNVTNFASTFGYCSVLNNLNISNWNTSNVTDMSSMFSSCAALTNLDLSHFDTSNVTTLSSTFNGCSALTSLNVKNWNTSKLTTMYSTFSSCKNIEEIDISGWNTSKVTSMYSLCQTCSKLKRIIGTIDMISCTSATTMFTSSFELETVTLKNIKTNIPLNNNKLTLDTLINTIKELWTYTSGTHTLTLGTTNKNKIKNTYVKLIDVTDEMLASDPNIASKKPCVVCASTDEGAMTLTEYATSKKWTIS